MRIYDMFADDINRKINGVIQVEQSDDDVIEQELHEYVITNELKKHFMREATSHVLITPSRRFPNGWQLQRSILRLSGSRLRQPGQKPGNPSLRRLS